MPQRRVTIGPAYEEVEFNITFRYISNRQDLIQKIKLNEDISRERLDMYWADININAFNLHARVTYSITPRLYTVKNITSNAPSWELTRQYGSELINTSVIPNFEHDVIYDPWFASMEYKNAQKWVDNLVKAGYKSRFPY